MYFSFYLPGLLQYTEWHGWGLSLWVVKGELEACSCCVRRVAVGWRGGWGQGRSFSCNEPSAFQAISLTSFSGTLITPFLIPGAHGMQLWEKKGKENFQGTNLFKMFIVIVCNEWYIKHPVYYLKGILNNSAGLSGYITMSVFSCVSNKSLGRRPNYHIHSGTGSKTVMLCIAQDVRSWNR